MSSEAEKNIRLNIEISNELQKKIKDYSLKNDVSIKEFITSLVEEKILKKQNISNNSINPELFFKEKTKNTDGKFKIAILCGGPSAERGISLNSARSALDHLKDDNVEITPFFIDIEKNPYLISQSQLYSNTPSDFDFKLKQTSRPLTEWEFIDELKKVDIVFPIIHGKYGEDGEIQSILEQNNIPYVGTNSSACRKAFNKQKSAEIMSENGFFVFPSLVLKKINDKTDEKVKRFFDLNKLKKAVVKPVVGGSSIGVHCVYSDVEAIDKVKLLFSQNINPVIIEPFCVGREFTIIVLQNHNNQKPVALIPSEIEMKYENYQIFDYRRKYLPTEQTRYHNPARFPDNVIQKIRNYAEQVFNLLELKDVARIDGWLLNDGRIWFSDINIASGMEQNSFVFQQSTRIGLTHSGFLKYIIKNACIRQKIHFPTFEEKSKNRAEVKVLFGGSNAEREVSLMSGTNVWLKLRNSKRYTAKPYLLDKNGDVWYLPYMYTLSHTVEEIYDNCINAESNLEKLSKFSKIICNELSLPEFTPDLPKKYTFDEFLQLAKDEKTFVFLGLHGGKGEDGTIQKKLDEYGITYNGSPSDVSKLCMDKYKTGEYVSDMHDENIITAPKLKFSIKSFDGWDIAKYRNFWDRAISDLGFSNFIIKPACDGSSAGAVRIFDCSELKTYIDLLNDKAPYIPANTFKNQTSIIEMPSNTEQEFLLESFIETDKLKIESYSGNDGNQNIIRKAKNGWLELTVGVIEKDGKYHSLNPSITVAENDILSVEEKFQGGTGINITPPPSDLISKESLEKIKLGIEKVSKKLNIKNYARIDIFFNTITDKMIVIEANTLPALTPSTVIYHQALTENPIMYPIDFLELLIDMKK